MKNYAKRIVAIMLIVVMVASLAACKGNKDKNQNTINADFTEFLVAEKVGTVNRENFMTNEGGLTYKGENGLYGVISFEGLRDTGAIFSKVVSVGEYFQVRKTEPTSRDDITGLNNSYLIDGKGKTIISSGYAAFHVLNERYILAATATKRTYNIDSAVMTYDEDLGLTNVTNYYTDEKDDWYEGTWCVIDVKTGRPVLGANGTNFQPKVSAKGDFIGVNNAEGGVAYINGEGRPLVEGATLFEDGSYMVESKIGEVFASDGTKLFSFDLTGYAPVSVSGDYYKASKYEDGKSTYAVLDKKGNIVSEGYTESISIYDEIVHSGDKIYNVQGENILEGTYTAVIEDKVFGNNWMIHNDDYYTLIDKDGKVFYNGGGKDANVRSNEFLAYVEKDDENYFYSHKDQDYTIKGHAFAPWIVKTDNANGMYDLVDTMTGKTLLEGYSNYTSISRRSLAYYVYAEYNGGADVYLIISGAQIAEVTEKKSRLYDDLIKAFEDEGITVSVNKESGEIALDSSVLFGGDSAELTANGKTFLNKFIKAYTTVVYSDKYTGFISKTMVEGHTAPVPGDTYADGYDLSVERATNVKNYCLSGETGIDVTPIANTLEAVGYSNSQPIYKADGTANMETSRRVSFRFMVNIEF